MKKRSIIILTLLAGCFTNSFAQKGEKTLTVEAVSYTHLRAHET